MYNEIEKMQDEISKILLQEGKRQVNATVKGDFNRIVGEGSTNKVVRPFGVSRRIKRSKMLINVCRKYDLIVMTTWFKKRNKH
jgi:hypothetical protein